MTDGLWGIGLSTNYTEHNLDKTDVIPRSQTQMHHNGDQTNCRGGIINKFNSFHTLWFVLNTKKGSWKKINFSVVISSTPIWQHISGSTLAQVMTCFMMIASHYLNHNYHPNWKLSNTLNSRQPPQISSNMRYGVSGESKDYNEITLYYQKYISDKKEYVLEI